MTPQTRQNRSQYRRTSNFFADSETVGTLKLNEEERPRMNPMGESGDGSPLPLEKVRTRKELEDAIEVGEWTS